MFKDRKVQIGLGVVLLVAVLLGGYFFVAGKSANKDVEEEYQAEVVQTASPEEFGLTMEASPDKKKIKFMLEKASGVKSIEYEITYEADSTAQEQNEGGEPRVQRGITGEAEVKGGSTYESEWLDLGSCSRNVCRYDKGVEKVDLTLKIVKSDGKTYQTQQSLEL